jgi:hypothetical protein
LPPQTLSWAGGPENGFSGDAPAAADRASRPVVNGARYGGGRRLVHPDAAHVQQQILAARATFSSDRTADLTLAAYGGAPPA